MGAQCLHSIASLPCIHICMYISKIRLSMNSFVAVKTLENWSPLYSFVALKIDADPLSGQPPPPKY